MGYRKRAHMMNAMIPGLRGPKMSASVPDSNIGFLDSPEAVQRKIEGAECDRVVVGNGILALLKEILFPIRQFRAEDGIQGFRNGDVVGEHTLSSVPINSQTGPVLKQYGSYERLEQDFLSGVLEVQALKLAVTEAINELLIPLRSIYEGNEEWQRVDKLGYPDVK